MLFCEIGALGHQDQLVVALARGISAARWVESNVGTKMAVQETFGSVQVRACLSVFSNVMVVFGYRDGGLRVLGCYTEASSTACGELVIDNGRRENLLPQ